MRKFSSHGDGRFERSEFKSLGDNVIIEAGALVFHPETISVGDNVYIGHGAMLKGYPGGYISIGDNVWIGQQCFMHGAGGLRIGSGIGIGPGTRILTSDHEDDGESESLLAAPVKFSSVVLEDNCHIGMSASILPGVTIGQRARVAAGAVVTENVPADSLAGGVPARIIRRKGASDPGDKTV